MYHLRMPRRGSWTLAVGRPGGPAHGIECIFQLSAPAGRRNVTKTGVSHLLRLWGAMK